MKWILFSALLWLSPLSHAVVDMKNANYSHTWIDIDVPGSGYKLEIARTYNSRSLFSGMFGFGWCSDFETKLEPTPEGHLLLTECGAGTQTWYSPREASTQDTSKVVQQIVTRMKESMKTQTADFFKQQAERLMHDPSYRAKLGRDYKISTPIKEGTIYNAGGRSVEHIVYKKTEYVRNFEDGSSQKFDLQGRLLGMFDKSGNYLKFSYDRNMLTDVSDNNGRRLSFKYSPATKRLSSITGPSGLSATYKFANLDDLASVKNGWGNFYTYEYDDLHNLTKATWPDKTSVQISYDKVRDWATSFKDRHGCTESYAYEDSKDDPMNHYWSTVKKVCGKEVVNESKFEFFHRKRSDGISYLHRTVASVNSNTTDIIYDETFGRPLTIKRNTEKVDYTYFPNGQLKTKTTPFARYFYEYDSRANKVSKVKTEFNNEKGKKVAEKVSAFKYDDKGLLTFAENSDGQKVTLTYDSKGRMATVTDQAKKLVKIQYDQKFGKPAIVTREGLGTIKISYKNNGEVDKANSPDGPQVATQVASAFNNLLDIIAPASGEVF